MTSRSTDTSPAVCARLAGLLGLVMLVAGTFAGSVSTRLIVPGDAAATTRNIMASASLFRLSSVSLLIMYTAFSVYIAVLYRLLRPVSTDTSLLMVLLALVGVPIAMLNQVNQAAALELVSGADYLKALPADQIQAQVMLFLNLHTEGSLIAAIFWGLWLFPLGLLVSRSGYFPRLLGVLLMIGCFGYLILYVQRVFLPTYKVIAHAQWAAHIAEPLWMFWLLVKGVNVEEWQKRAREATQ